MFVEGHTHMSFISPKLGVGRLFFFSNFTDGFGDSLAILLVTVTYTLSNFLSFQVRISQELLIKSPQMTTPCLKLIHTKSTS